VFWLTIPAIVFTYSRGALLGLLSVAPFLAWRYRKRFVIAGVAGAIAVVGIYQFAPDRWFERQATIQEYQVDHSAMQRIQAWGVAFNVATDRPFRGAGFNFEEGGNTARWLSYANFVEPWANTSRAAHSIYFQVMGEHGMLAFILFVTLMAGTFLRLNRLGKLERREGYEWIGVYARAVQVSMIPYATAGAFLSLAYFDLFYTLVALSAILEFEYRAVRDGTAEPVGARTEGSSGGRLQGDAQPAPHPRYDNTHQW
jgi:probable O-glycosylation ligase (exosortase A-associated)